MKLNISVALEEGETHDYSVKLADGTVLTPTNGNVHLDAEPFLFKEQKKDETDAQQSEAKKGFFGGKK